MVNRKLVFVSAKAIAGLVLIMLAFEHPQITMGVLAFCFLALYAANFVLNSVHYVVWNNFKPRLVSYQRLDREPKHTIPKNSILGQAISLILQMLGYGLLLAFAITGIASLIIHFFKA